MRVVSSFNIAEKENDKVLLGDEITVLPVLSKKACFLKVLKTNVKRKDWLEVLCTFKTKIVFDDFFHCSTFELPCDSVYDDMCELCKMKDSVKYLR